MGILRGLARSLRDQGKIEEARVAELRAADFGGDLLGDASRADA